MRWEGAVAVCAAPCTSPAAAGGSAARTSLKQGVHAAAPLLGAAHSKSPLARNLRATGHSEGGESGWRMPAGAWLASHLAVRFERATAARRCCKFRRAGRVNRERPTGAACTAVLVATSGPFPRHALAMRAVPALLQVIVCESMTKWYQEINEGLEACTQSAPMQPAWLKRRKRELLARLAGFKALPSACQSGQSGSKKRHPAGSSGCRRAALLQALRRCRQRPAVPAAAAGVPAPRCTARWPGGSACGAPTPPPRPAGGRT